MAWRRRSCARGGPKERPERAASAAPAAGRSRGRTGRPSTPTSSLWSAGSTSRGRSGGARRSPWRSRSTKYERLILARAAFPPHEGRAKVYVIRRAEELSTSAANALLKTLEEPIARTHFVLLSAQAETLLPTIRSRTQRIRFGPLPDDVVRELLTQRGVGGQDEITRLAAGSMAQALSLADPDDTEKRDAFVSRAMKALEGTDINPAMDLAEDAKKAGKDALIRLLVAFGAAIAARAAALAKEGAAGRAVDAWAARYPLTLTAIEQLEGNASAQLVMEAMLLRMRAA